MHLSQKVPAAASSRNPDQSSLSHRRTFPDASHSRGHVVMNLKKKKCVAFKINLFCHLFFFFFFLHAVSSINNRTSVSECDEKWRLRVAEGYAEWHPSCSRSPLSLLFSYRLFPPCILFIHASCNCITILRSQYLLSPPSDCNTIRLRADAIGFSFYMQSISVNWLLTLKLAYSFTQGADTPQRAAAL